MFRNGVRFLWGRVSHKRYMGGLVLIQKGHKIMVYKESARCIRTMSLW